MAAVPADFPWRAGMLDAVSGDRAFDADGMLVVDGMDSGYETRSDNAVPDLTDPATLGALLGAVREAYGDDGMSTSADERVWAVRRRTRRCFCETVATGKTEAAALLSAWAKRPTAPR